MEKKCLWKSLDRGDKKLALQWYLNLPVWSKVPLGSKLCHNTNVLSTIKCIWPVTQSFIEDSTQNSMPTKTLHTCEVSICPRCHWTLTHWSRFAKMAVIHSPEKSTWGLESGTKISPKKSILIDTESVTRLFQQGISLCPSHCLWAADISLLIYHGDFRYHCPDFWENGFLEQKTLKERSPWIQLPEKLSEGTTVHIYVVCLERTS